jgi:hypothetical protein
MIGLGQSGHREVSATGHCARIIIEQQPVPETSISLPGFRFAASLTV